MTNPDYEEHVQRIQSQMVWEDPPDIPQPALSLIRPAVDAIRANPGRWAIVKTEARASAGHAYGKTYRDVQFRSHCTGKDEVGVRRFTVYGRVRPETGEADAS